MRHDRRALLKGAPSFLQRQPDPPEVAKLRRYLDSRRGVSDVVAGLRAQGFDIEMRQFPRGWRVSIYPTGTAHSIVVPSAWELTPWRAVQQAGVVSSLAS
jgi:hypothetical protein